MTLTYDTSVGLTSSTMINRLYKKINEIRIAQTRVTTPIVSAMKSRPGMARDHEKNTY